MFPNGIERNRARKLEELKVEGTKRGWILCTKVYGGKRSKVEYTCGLLNHASFFINAQYVKTYLGCSICNLIPKVAAAIQKFHEILKSKGGTIIEGEYSNSRSEFKIRCINGHEFTTEVRNINTHHWCPDCHRDKIVEQSAEKFRKEVVRRGGTCNDTYIGDPYKLQIFCADGHGFKMNPHDVKQGSFCPKCAGNCPIQGRKEFYEEIARRKATCIDDYIDSNTKIKIVCCAGHEFMSRPNSVRRGLWCTGCTINIVVYQAEQRYYAEVERRGGNWIDEYNGSRTKVKILCDQGHTFESTPFSITNHLTWCSICCESAGESEVRQILTSLNLLFEGQYTTNETGRCRYDFVVYHNNKHIFIEYDGAQHFRETFFASGEAFVKARHRDIFKARTVIQHHRCKMIRIDYESRLKKLDLKQFIIKAFESDELLVLSNPEMYRWLSYDLSRPQQEGALMWDLSDIDEEGSNVDGDSENFIHLPETEIATALASVTLC